MKYVVRNIEKAGDVTIDYYHDGRIKSIEFDECLEDTRKSVFLTRAPLLEADMEYWAQFKQIEVVRVADEIDFNAFWAEYAYKVAKTKALSAWNRLSRNDRYKAYAGIAKYNNYLKRNTYIQRMNPATYLNGRRWEDEA